MKILTRDFGEQDVLAESIIKFPKGIFAFEDDKEFALLSPLGKEASPKWLQSTREIKPCFIVFDTKEIISNYEPSPLDDDLKTIDYSEGNTLEYLSIAIIPKDYKQTTINLKSPIIINKTKLLAVQAILPDDYPIRFPIYEKGEDK